MSFSATEAGTIYMQIRRMDARRPCPDIPRSKTASVALFANSSALEIDRPCGAIDAVVHLVPGIQSSRPGCGASAQAARPNTINPVGASPVADLTMPPISKNRRGRKLPRQLMAPASHGLGP